MVEQEGTHDMEEALFCLARQCHFLLRQEGRCQVQESDGLDGAGMEGREGGREGRKSGMSLLWLIFEG